MSSSSQNLPIVFPLLEFATTMDSKGRLRIPLEIFRCLTFEGNKIDQLYGVIHKDVRRVYPFKPDISEDNIITLSVDAHQRVSVPMSLRSGFQNTKLIIKSNSDHFFACKLEVYQTLFLS